MIVARPRASFEDNELIGYVVSRHEPALALGELRSFLQEKLPEYMIPSLFVFLDTLPLTPNGKVDRNALPPPGGERPLPSQDFVEPRTEVEELVAQIWREVLQRDTIGVHDNFFELGGHSILAAISLSRVQQIYSKDISLREFFEFPTIAGLIAVVERKHGSRKKRNLPPLTPVSRDKYYPLSLAQKQLWLLDQILPGTYFLNMPYAYRLTGNLNIAALRHSIQEIVRRHEALHMIFTEIGGQPVQSIGKVPVLDLPIIDLRALSKEEQMTHFNRLSADDATLPFDLEEGPLIRVQLICLTDQEQVLLATTHHIVCDDWSMQIFRRELVELYESFSHGKPSPLPDLTIHFIDYVCWQRDLVKRGLLKAQLAYWRKQLGDRLAQPLPRDSPGTANDTSFSMAIQRIDIDDALLPKIKAFAIREGCTTFMVYLAVIYLVLHVHTGNTDVFVGTTTGNRKDRTIEGVIGNFLNAVVLRTDIQRHHTFSQLLHRVRQVCIEAYDNQEIPFANVARALRRQIPIKPRTPEPIHVHLPEAFVSAGVASWNNICSGGASTATTRERYIDFTATVDLRAARNVN